MISKKKRPSRKILKDKAWTIFSVYIRLRDRATCFTCDKRIWDEDIGEFTIKGFNAGHYIHNVLDFDEMNINCQCIRCNHHLSGNLGEYSLRLIEKYGLEAVNQLRLRGKNALRGEILSTEEYQTIIDKYTKLISDMT